MSSNTSKYACPKCGNPNTHIERRPNGFCYCPDCQYRWQIGESQPKPTVFDSITTSPEVLAEKLVFAIGSIVPDYNHVVTLWYSTIIPNITFETRTKAIAATVENLYFRFGIFHFLRGCYWFLLHRIAGHFEREKKGTKQMFIITFRDIVFLILLGLMVTPFVLLLLWQGIISVFTAIRMKMQGFSRCGRSRQYMLQCEDYDTGFCTRSNGKECEFHPKYEEPSK